MTTADDGALTGEILVIDDDEEARRALIDVLEAKGHDCSEATDGRLGLLAIKNFSPDVVILDANLPHLDGVTVLSRIRATPETLHLPVIMITGTPGFKEQQRVARLRVVDYLQKPADPAEIEQRVEWALQAGEGAESPFFASASTDAARPLADAGQVHETAGNEPVEAPVESGDKPRGPAALDHGEGHSRRNGWNGRGNQTAPQAALGFAESLQAQLERVEKLNPAEVQNLEHDGDERLLRLQEFDRATRNWVEVATFVDPTPRDIARVAGRVAGARPAEEKPRILIVEPREQEFRRVLASLEGAPYDIAREAHPARACERIARERPSLVVLGLGLAGPGGVRLLQEIRTNPATRHCGVIPVVRPGDRDIYPGGGNGNGHSALFSPVHAGGLHNRLTRALAAAAVQQSRPAARRRSTRAPGAKGGPPTGPAARADVVSGALTPANGRAAA